MDSAAIVKQARCIISHRLRKLARRMRLAELGRQDLEQDLLCDVLERLPRFDPSRGTLGTFIARVVERRIATIVRHRQAPKRDHRRNGPSLNDEVIDETGCLVERAETIDCMTNRPGRSDEEHCELSLDVQAVVEKLPADLRELCLRLRSESVAEIVRTTGMPRTTVYDAIHRIRQHFKAAGMENYL